MTTYIAAVNETALVVFAVVVGVTMVVTYFASKRVSTATDFWAAGRGLTGPQNGFAIAGLVISASGAVAHDIWSNIVRKGRDSEKEEVWVAKIAAVAVGAIAIGIAIIGGEGLNVSFMVGLAFAVAASANFPALLLALTWRRFNTAGAVTGVLFGVISSVGLVIISPTVWPGPDSEGGALSWYDLTQPGLISVPLGFIGCWLGTVLTTERGAERTFDELYVRSETGLGAEEGTGLTLTGREEERRVPAGATATLPPG